MTRLSMVRGGFLPISLLLAIAGVGCGDGDGMVDMGTDLGTDQGPPADMGPEDEGVDLGPELPPPQVRVVHAVSDLLTSTDVPIQGIRLCVEIAGLGTVIAQPANADLLPDLFDLRDGLPFRAVTPYLETLPASTVRVYDEALVDNDEQGATQPAVDCPMTALDADCTNDTPVPCLFQFAYDPTDLDDGESYSLFVSGFADNTDTCMNQAMEPIDCPNADANGTLVQDEDVDDVVAGSARVRFFHGIHNLFAVDVCYDLDGLAGMAAAPTLIHGSVAPGTVTGYVTVPPVTTGFVFLTLKTGAPGTTTPCGVSFDQDTMMPTNVVPVFFSPANAMSMNFTPNVAAGTILTIFATGDTRYSERPMTLPMDDQFNWANYSGRTPIPLAFTDYEPAP